jgi:hypothetical protein
MSCTVALMIGAEMVPETFGVFFSETVLPIAGEDFINVSRHGSITSSHVLFLTLSSK